MWLIEQELSAGLRPKPRLLESKVEEIQFNMLPRGETGEDSLTQIPFQVVLDMISLLSFFETNVCVSICLSLFYRYDAKFYLIVVN